MFWGAKIGKLLGMDGFCLLTVFCGDSGLTIESKLGISNNKKIEPLTLIKKMTNTKTLYYD